MHLDAHAHGPAPLIRGAALLLALSWIAGPSRGAEEPPAAPAPKAAGIVVIDPGHGGSERIGDSSPNNATGPQGTKEKDLTLEISKGVAEALRAKGIDVRMTRTEDVNVGLADRAKVAHDCNADAFVAIHMNGFHIPTVQGTETLHAPDASDASKALAKAVQRRMVAAIGHRDRGVKPQELGVLRPGRHLPTTAACLAEVSFLSDPEEEVRLMDKAYKQRISAAIAEGIADYLSSR
jgi:N-acetylmuramoyl-L-alanine amidase